MRAEAAQTRCEVRIDSRTVIVHNGPEVRNPRLTVFWLGGTPHSGALLAPHLAAASARDIRLVSVARPGFGGSHRLEGRSVADAASDVVRSADILGLEKFAVVGYSGGGPHALAVGAQAGERVVGIATFGSPAPITDTDDWFDGMQDPSALLSAQRGRAARERWEESAVFDPEQFIADDYAALDGSLAALGDEVTHAIDLDTGGSVDDDLALVAPWGVDLAEITADVQLVHGTADRVIPFSHAVHLSTLCATAQVIALPDRGHVGVLLEWEAALDRMLPGHV